MSSIPSTFPPPSAVSLKDRLYARITVRLMPVLMLAFIAAQIDRVNVGFAKAQMQSALDFSDAVYGLGAGIFFIGYFLFEVPSNAILARVGARRWLARIVITWGIMSAMTAFVQTPGQFYVVRFLIGVAEAGFAPGVIYYLSTWFPNSRRGRATSYVGISIPLAFILGAPISGWILHSFAGSTIMAPWRWLFVLEALPALVAGILLLIFLNDDIKSAKWLSEEDKSMVEEDLRIDNREKVAGIPLTEMFRLPAVWMLSFIYFCLLMGLYGLNFWMPSLIMRSGVSNELTVGLLTAIPFTAALIAILVTGRTADRTRMRRAHFSGAMFMGAAALAGAMAIGGGPVATVLALSVAAAGLLSATILIWAFPTAMMQGATAAIGIAIVNSLGNLAGFVSPFAVGWLNVRTGNPELGMYLITVVVTIGAIAALTLPARVVDK
ncbi:MFS family permease [Bradyrhizobium sp. LM6.10]|uniref:MFS transporter n=1 Tax=Bradyrhizobium sp. 174 TaxID=2782645 RepID=UPI001FFBEE29|nr:MFS transporter [Bradyrhizobium sp. 174]MCK1572805.1 MFS transporter [Bradyrhizobium sp. 174]